MNYSILYILTILIILSIQGSYGLVKLAYNELDDKHYVSISNII